ncbi:hypothetical protein [Amycolatopsis sp. NPDC006125]|uniref:hypothetical protein n=1 Tax=Amycolatopsis sp. NPDC006125 TaxID=3156730 RepID=UPI0033B27A23
MSAGIVHSTTDSPVVVRASVHHQNADRPVFHDAGQRRASATHRQASRSGAVEDGHHD